MRKKIFPLFTSTQDSFVHNINEFPMWVHNQNPLLEQPFTEINYFNTLAIRVENASQMVGLRGKKGAMILECGYRDPEEMC